MKHKHNNSCIHSATFCSQICWSDSLTVIRIVRVMPSLLSSPSSLLWWACLLLLVIFSVLAPLQCCGFKILVASRFSVRSDRFTNTCSNWLIFIQLSDDFNSHSGSTDFLLTLSSYITGLCLKWWGSDLLCLPSTDFVFLLADNGIRYRKCLFQTKLINIPLSHCAVV